MTCEGKIKNFNIGGTENWGQAKGAYRFFGNRKVTVEQIVKPYIERILCQDEDVLTIHDAKNVVLTYHAASTGLGNRGHMALFVALAEVNATQHLVSEK